MCCSSVGVLADTCLQTDKKGREGDSRYYDYGRCKPAAGANDSYNSLTAVGKQLESIMSRNNDPSDRGYSDAERSENMRTIAQLNKEFDTRRAFVKLGATVELDRQEYFQLNAWQYQNAAITDSQIQDIRKEIGASIEAGTLLDKYGNQGYEDPKNAATWSATDPVTRWKTCEVATQLSRAYAFGDLINPEQKNPALGLAIAKAGYAQHCGGTSYWLGRIYEEGNALVPGVDKKDIGKDPKALFTDIYDVAILNGYTPAFERMAELYRLHGPARYRDKAWSASPWDDGMYMMKVQYSKCLQAEPTNLVCARGLRTIYSDTTKKFDYTNYNAELATFYTNYVAKLEGLLTQAGIPIPAAD